VSEAIEKGTINLENEADLDEFIEDLQNIQGNEFGRAASLNLLNINNGRNTIEFRVANGTINPDTWIENARLFGRVVQISEKLAQIEKKSISELTEEDKKILNLMEQLKEEKPEHEKLEVLLELLFTEQEKTVYRERYVENSKKLEEAIKRGDNPLEVLKSSKKVEFKNKRHSIDEFSDIANKNRQGNYGLVAAETRSGIIGETAREENTEEREDN